MRSIDNPLLHLKPDDVDRLIRHFVQDYHLENQSETFIRVGSSLQSPPDVQALFERRGLTDYRLAGFCGTPKHGKACLD